MPALVRLYIRNVIIGFALSVVFVGALLGLNVANLWHLVSTSPMGWVAGLMLFVFNGIVFAGVQFGIVIMQMETGARAAAGGAGCRSPRAFPHLRRRRPGRGPAPSATDQPGEGGGNRGSRGGVFFPRAWTDQVGAGYRDHGPGRASSLGRDYRPLEKGLAREGQNPPPPNLGRARHSGKGCRKVRNP